MKIKTASDRTLGLATLAASGLLASLCLLGVFGCPATPAPPPDPVAAPTPSPPTGRTLRFLSMAIRDTSPSVGETKAFVDGERSIDSFVTEWLASAEHEDHVRRYFGDFFGVNANFTPFNQYLLEKNASGVYRLPLKPDCTLEEALAAPAWWLDEGETILICPTSASDAFLFPSEDPAIIATCADHDPRNVSDGCSVLCDNIFNLEFDPRCGCGPEQMLCMPCEPTGADICDSAQGRGRNRELEREFTIEPIERGMFAYRNGMSWFDYIGGDFFFGNRALYLYYLEGQGQLMTGELSAADAITQLRAIPLNDRVRAEWPAGPLARAGVVTSPGYLSVYNTFRSRVRTLSQRLLCHDVEETLNIDKYEGFLNPDLSESDRAHGSNRSCSYCHYGMDNQASMLFGYNLTGVSEYYLPALPSQVGHVFGIDAEGPAELVRGYIERGGGFDECMARRAFTSFTGLDWETALTSTERADFTKIAKNGPRDLIQGILQSPILRAAAPE